MLFIVPFPLAALGTSSGTTTPPALYSEVETFLFKLLCPQSITGLIIGRNGDTVPGQNNVIIIAPPFITTEEDLHFIVDTVKEAIHQL